MKAGLGQKIRFKRNNMVITGIVSLVKDNSVIVDISNEDAKKLEYSTNKTVVNHSNYEIVNDEAPTAL